MGLEMGKAWVRIRGDSSALPGDLAQAQSAVYSSVEGMSNVSGKIPLGFVAAESFLDKVSGITATSIAAFTGVTAAVMGLRKAIWSAGGFEQTNIAFQTMIGTASETKKTLANLTEFAAKTPFEMPEIESAARGLIQFGERGEDLMDTLKMLGDAASGTSTPFGFLALVFNQIRGVGKLLTQDFRQLSTRGILSLQDIADYYGVATDAAQEMISKGKVSFEDVRGIFKMLTEDGGRFANMMEKQSQSFLGLWSTLTDAINIIVRQFGQTLLPIAKQVLNVFIYLSEVLSVIAQNGFAQKVMKWTTALTVLAGTVRLTAKAFMLLKAAIFAANLSLKKFLASTGIGLLLVGLGVALEMLVEHLTGSADAAEEFGNKMQGMTNSIEAATSQLKEMDSRIERLQKKAAAGVMIDADWIGLASLKKEKEELERHIADLEAKRQAAEKESLAGSKSTNSDPMHHRSKQSWFTRSKFVDYVFFDDVFKREKAIGERLDAIREENLKAAAIANAKEEAEWARLAEIRNKAAEEAKSFQDMLDSIGASPLKGLSVQEMHERFGKILNNAKSLSVEMQKALAVFYEGGTIEGGARSVDILTKAFDSLKPSAQDIEAEFQNIRATILYLAKNGILSAAEATKLLQSEWERLHPQQVQIQKDLEGIRQRLEDAYNNTDDITKQVREWAEATGASAEQIKEYEDALRRIKGIEESREKAKKEQERIKEATEGAQKSMQDLRREILMLQKGFSDIEKQALQWARSFGLGQDETKRLFEERKKLLQQQKDLQDIEAIQQEFKTPAEKWKEAVTRMQELVAQGLDPELAQKKLGKTWQELFGGGQQQQWGTRSGLRDMGKTIQDSILRGRAEQLDEKRNGLLGQLVEGNKDVARAVREKKGGLAP